MDEKLDVVDLKTIIAWAKESMVMKDFFGKQDNETLEKITAMMKREIFNGVTGKRLKNARKR